MNAAPTPRVGDYEIVGVLGSGGMGNVFKVRNVISDRIEAMKILLPDLAGQQELADRFRREIKVLARLDHPNIAALRTALSWDNRLVMIMEYVEGVSLAERLEQGPFPPGEATDYSEQVLGALAYAHSLHIIHRDIKPANIMLTPQHAVKLMDFGIARCESDASLTVSGTTLGSLYYMSPEQVKGEPADERSDLYSLGVSLYEMVTGKRPFEADSSFAIMAAHLQRQPEPPIKLRIDLPAGLNEIILQAMAKDPAQRFQSANEFCRALKNVRVNRSIPVSKGGVTTLGDSVNTAILAIETAPNALADGVKSASERTQVSGPQGAFATRRQNQPAVRLPDPPAAPTQYPPPLQKLEDLPPLSAKRTPNRGLYIGLGALIVLLALLVDGIYFPRRNSTHAGNDATRVERSGTAYKPEVEDTKRPVTTTPASPAAQTSTDSGSHPTVPKTVMMQRVAPAASYPNGGGGTRTVPAITEGPSRAAASTDKRNIWTNAALQGKAQTEKQGGLSETSGSKGSSPVAAAESDQLEQVAHDFDLLSSRADSVNDSLTTLRETQRTQGLGLRGDIASAQQRMQRYVARAQSALRNQDARDAKKYLDLAEAEVTTLEKFLGR